MARPRNSGALAETEGLGWRTNFALATLWQFKPLPNNARRELAANNKL
jgi:hypothetical protein